jgi:alkyl sulfatase BDS1-like metallo-beta-lactamase superfamily hydrolase
MLLDHLVFADPKDTDARALLATVYDQLGYQAESGPWRDAYLTGALELRRGVQRNAVDVAALSDLLLHLPLDVFFASFAARLDGPAAEGKTTRINMIFTDVNESWVLWLENAVLHAKRHDADPAAAATIKLTRPMLVRLITNQVALSELVTSSDLDVDGSRLELLGFLRLLDRPGEPFAIVEP